MPYNYIQNLIYARQWVWVFLYGYVQFSETYFLFFLGTTIIGDNQVAPSIGYINPVTNNLSMFYFKVVA
jgi:hypothetical protein